MGVKRRCLACGGTLAASYVGPRCGMCGRGPMVDLEGSTVNRMSGPGSDPKTGGPCQHCRGSSGTLSKPCPFCARPEAGDICPFCLGAGSRKEPGSLEVPCSWCRQPLLPPEVVRETARARQARIEAVLA